MITSKTEDRDDQPITVHVLGDSPPLSECTLVPTWLVQEGYRELGFEVVHAVMTSLTDEHLGNDVEAIERRTRELISEAMRAANPHDTSGRAVSVDMRTDGSCVVGTIDPKDPSEFDVLDSWIQLRPTQAMFLVRRILRALADSDSTVLL